MVRFKIWLAGSWVEVDQGTILPDGRRLRWRSFKGNQTFDGVADLGKWQLHESTKNSTWFKAACWNSLNVEEKALAIARKPDLIQFAA